MSVIYDKILNKLRDDGSSGLDSRYVNVTGDTVTGNLIFNDSVSLLLGTGSDGKLFHDGTNTYFQNNTGGIIIENDASDGDITFKVNDGGVDTTVMTIDGATGNVGIGTTGPTAVLHLKACTATANTASLKINAGTVATTPVSGNIESDGTHLYWTDSGGTRRQLDN